MQPDAVPGRSLSREEQTTIARRRMLEAAIQLLAKRGYDNTTLAAIGERAGYSRGLATHHFGSKSHLFAELIRAISVRSREELEANLEGLEGVGALCAFADSQRAFLQADPAAGRALLVLWFQSAIDESPMRGAATRDLLGHRERVREIIERGVAGATIRADVDAHAEAIQFCGSLFGLALQWLIDPERSRLDEMHQLLKEKLRASLSP